ncbi:sortase [Aeromicrobium sp. NPDC092404]|uniref:sortase domain-containing protein n=1 Tax=Aeromicrobium sp. NPDC092404 TaxID=3154976 RepID=UPI00342D0CC1
MNRIVRTILITATAWAVLSGLTGSTTEPERRVAVAPVAVPAPQPAPTPVVVPHEAGPVGKPTRLAIPTIGVDERLHGVGLKPDGAMQTPDFGDAGWYDVGPRPGAAGPAVLVAHVHGPAGDDVFARLHELEPGDRVTVERTDGRAVFVVESVEQAAKDALPHERIWNDTEVPVLRLITCGGKPDPVTRMYPDNTIVYARLAF